VLRALWLLNPDEPLGWVVGPISDQKVGAWHGATTKDTDLVMNPLRMALRQRDREGHPVNRGELIGHADAGLPYTFIRFNMHLKLVRCPGLNGM
jgi:putative transposase